MVVCHDKIGGVWYCWWWRWSPKSRHPSLIHAKSTVSRADKCIGWQIGFHGQIR